MIPGLPTASAAAEGPHLRRDGRCLLRAEGGEEAGGGQVGEHGVALRRDVALQRRNLAGQRHDALHMGVCWVCVELQQHWGLRRAAGSAACLQGRTQFLLGAAQSGLRLLGLAASEGRWQGREA